VNERQSLKGVLPFNRTMHVRAARIASVPLDKGRFVYDRKFVAILNN
jgi:hypothetical protein